MNATAQAVQGALDALAAAPLTESRVTGAWRVDVSPRLSRARIHVEEDLTAVLTLPPSADERAAVRFARGRIGWVARQRNQLAPYVPDHPVKELVSGASFKVFGYNRRLSIIRDPAAPPVELEPNPMGYLRLRSDKTAASIIAWYAERLQETVSKEGGHWFPYWARRLGLAVVPPLEISAPGPRQWSKYARGTVHLHWALAQLDYILIQSVIVHALAHATEPPGGKHGPEFRRRLLRALPDAVQLDERLRKEGGRIWLGDTAPLDA